MDIETTRIGDNPVEIKKSYLGMIRAFPGGWAAISAALGMSESALNNRVYERKGQRVDVETAMQLQAFSGTTLFAEAVARDSGGVFFRLPEAAIDITNEELLSKLTQLLTELGSLSETHNRAIEDGVIDDEEKDRLDKIAERIHRRLQEFMAQTYRVFWRSRDAAADEKRG